MEENHIGGEREGRRVVCVCVCVWGGGLAVNTVRRALLSLQDVSRSPLSFSSLARREYNYNMLAVVYKRW